MSNKKSCCLSKWLLFIIFILLIIVEVSAVDFSLSPTQNSLSICPSSTGLLTMVVSNLEEGESKYTISTTGDASVWSTSVPLGFVLNGRESKTIYTYISPKFGANPGEYGLTVTVSSNGFSKKIDYKVEILDCFKVTIRALDEKKIVCPGEIDSFSFLVSNNGQFSDQYLLSVEGSAKDFITLSQNYLELESGESKEVIAFVNAPKERAAEYQFSVIAKSANRVSSATSILEVGSCFDYELNTEEDFVSMCDRSTKMVPITIKNSGTVSNTYSLDIEGPIWSTLEKNSLTIGSDEEEIVNLIVSPDYKIEGSFDIKVLVTTERGKVGQEKIVKVSVRRCNLVDVEIVQSSDKICNSLSNTYGVVIKNTGEVDNEYAVTLKGPDWATFEEGILKLEAGEEKTLTLSINPSSEVGNGVFEIKINAETLKGGISDEDSINIETVSTEDCYKPSISADTKLLEVGADSSATAAVVIENKGTNKATYELGLSGSAANFVQLNPASVEIDAGKAEVVYLYAAPSNEQELRDYSLTITAKLKGTPILDSDTIRVRVVEEKEEVVPVTPTTEEKPENVSKVTGFATLGKSIITYKWYVLGGLLLLIIVIILLIIIRKGLFKSLAKLFEEEEVKKEKPKEEKPKEEKIKKEVKVKKEIKEVKKEDGFGVWRYIALILVLAVIIFTLGYFKLFGLFKIYIWYIITGILILVILFIAMRRGGFKGLIDFFEEEEEVKKEKPKEVAKEEKPKEEKIKKEVKVKKEIKEVKKEDGFGVWRYIALIIVLAILIFILSYFKVMDNIGFYKWYVLGGLLLLIIVIILLIIIRKGLFKSLAKLFEEEEVKKEKPKEEKPKEEKIKKEVKVVVKEEKVGASPWRFFIGLILLAIVAYVVVGYSTVQNLKMYKWYIIIGVVLLIILLILTKTKLLKGFSDFFSEED